MYVPNVTTHAHPVDLTDQEPAKQWDFEPMEFAVMDPTPPIRVPLRNMKRVSKPIPRRSGEPDWASGLRQLYDSVLNEPLPDSFDDLLGKLDRDQNA